MQFWRKILAHWHCTHPVELDLSMQRREHEIRRSVLRRLHARFKSGGQSAGDEPKTSEKDKA
jgi:hypothetical protein